MSQSKKPRRPPVERLVRKYLHSKQLLPLQVRRPVAR